jgi:hypothetical protein
MAMIALAVQDIVIASIQPSYVAANTDGQWFINDGATFFHVKNGSGVPTTLTFATPAKLAGVDVVEWAVVCGAGIDKMIGPFDPAVFNQGDGTVQVTYSAITTITVGAFKMKRS